MIVVDKIGKQKEGCKHEVGECYVEDDFVGDPVFVAHIVSEFNDLIEDCDFYALINIRTGETICVDKSIEIMDMYNKNHRHIETELVVKGVIS